jgi:hypothetical protein
LPSSAKVVKPAKESRESNEEDKDDKEEEAAEKGDVEMKEDRDDDEEEEGKVSWFAHRRSSKLIPSLMTMRAKTRELNYLSLPRKTRTTKRTTKLSKKSQRPKLNQ